MMSHGLRLQSMVYSDIHDRLQRAALREPDSAMEKEPLLKAPERPSRVPTRNLLLALFAVGIGGAFQYGYNISVINAPTAYIQKFINETWADRYRKELDENTLTFIWSVIVSIYNFGSLVGVVVGGVMAVKLGRKGALLTNNSIALLATGFMGIAYPSGIFEFLIIGRFLIGINAGTGVVVHILYLGEIAPKHLRGSMILGCSIFLTSGIIAGQIIGLRELLGGEEYWPILVCTSCVPAILQLLVLPWFPESPRYLLIDRNEETKCIKALKTFHGSANYQPELDDIKKEMYVLNGEKPKTIWEMFTDPSIKWQLIATIVFNAAGQLSGVNAIYYYATYIFSNAGLPEQFISYAAVGAGGFELIAAISCGILIEYAGRRILIIGGYTLMAVWCLVLTVTLTFQDVSSWIPYLSMTAIFAYIVSYGLGPGGVSLTLMTEMFTQPSRPAAVMIGSSVGGISSFIIAMIMPFIVTGLKNYCFLVFFVECSLAATFIFFIIPETKNKSFLEIKESFQHLNRTNRILNPEQNGEIVVGTDL